MEAEVANSGAARLRGRDACEGLSTAGRELSAARWRRTGVERSGSWGQLGRAATRRFAWALFASCVGEKLLQSRIKHVHVLKRWKLKSNTGTPVPEHWQGARGLTVNTYQQQCAATAGVNPILALLMAALYAKSRKQSLCCAWHNTAHRVLEGRANSGTWHVDTDKPNCAWGE